MIKLCNDSGVTILSEPVKTYIYDPKLVNINNNFIGYPYATHYNQNRDGSGFDSGFGSGFS